MAAQLMRRGLVDHARTQQATKRGSGALRLSLNELTGKVKEKDAEVIALDDALAELQTFDPQQSRIVELCYFAGLSIAETAQIVGISPATVKREWNTAKAWLYNQLKCESKR